MTSLPALRHGLVPAPRRFGACAMQAGTDKYLGIYLNDHLGGSTAGLELAKRIRGESEGTELGAFMQGLVDEIAEDRETLLEFMDAVDAGPSRLKVAGGWITEKLGRLKLNGELIGDSPLSRFVELESLSLGVEGKRLLWIALLDTRPERFGAERLRELIARAERQRVGIEEHRRKAAREALGG
ncbi:MAG: hypothetical protein QOG77_613 [Solirubrobacteraceae bacterium]|nr:hypothetical protein [Solirubrobacteraceae bacterium]